MEDVGILVDRGELKPPETCQKLGHPFCATPTSMRLGLGTKQLALLHRRVKLKTAWVR